MGSLEGLPNPIVNPLVSTLMADLYHRDPKDQAGMVGCSTKSFTSLCIGLGDGTFHSYERDLFVGIATSLTRVTRRQALFDVTVNRMRNLIWVFPSGLCLAMTDGVLMQCECPTATSCMIDTNYETLAYFPILGRYNLSCQPRYRVTSSF
ncbi:hypothetical protein VNO77_27237 [Canavalia gladiata]|uniref:Uncharacterized protein n=1 Tax=Canavalia gladiata TaxID=3824 RepID=A0AAN9KV07_CANGL